MTAHPPDEAGDAALAALQPEDPAPDLAGDTDMRPLHPLTPLLKSWVVVAAGLGYVGTQITGAIEGRLFGSAFGESDDGLPLLVWGLLFAGALAVGLGYGYLYWRFTRYAIVSDVLRVQTGVVFRQTRQVSLDRLQAVDIVRPFIARLVGLAELRLEVAGGSSSEAPLAYLSLPDARRLRAELLARAAGLDATTPEAPERPLVRVSLAHLVLGSLLSGATFALVILGGGVAVGVVLSGQAGFILPLVPALIGSVVAAARQFTTNFGFTVAESPDGLRIRKGLLDTRSQTVPPGRVQAIRLSQPLLWRMADLVRLDLNVAGYAGSNESETQKSSVLLPVGPRADAELLLARVLPGIDPSALPMQRTVPRARRLRPIGWRYLAAGATDTVFAAREGWLRRDLVLMPHAKPQSMRLTQGPLQRRLRLADVHLDSPKGPVSVVARHRDEADARRILDAEAERERQARRSAAPDRWETRGSLGGPEPLGQVDPDRLDQPAKVTEPRRVE